MLSAYILSFHMQILSEFEISQIFWIAHFVLRYYGLAYNVADLDSHSKLANGLSESAHLINSIPSPFIFPVPFSPLTLLSAETTAPEHGYQSAVQ